MMMIDNNDASDEQYEIHTYSNTGADGSGSVVNYSGSFSVYENDDASNGDEYYINYEVHQIYGTSDPSICEVFFTVQSQNAWSSNPYNMFTLQNQLRLDSQNFDTGYIENTATISGFPRNMAFGFFLLSRNMEIQKAVREMANTIAGPGYGKDFPFPPMEPSSTTEQTTTTTGSTTSEPSYTSSTQAPPMDETVSSYVVRQLFDARFQLRSNIPGYHVYDSADYDLYEISDGGRDMYDGGNMVQITDDNGNLQNIKYGDSYRYNYGDAASVASSPFHAAVWIQNDDYDNMYDYVFRVHGNPGSDGYGNIAIWNGELQLGNGFQANWVSYQIYGADDASIVELYYGISNPSLWGSSDFWESNTGLTNMWGNFTFGPDGLTDLDNVLRLTAQTRRTLAMYSLLSRTNGDLMTQDEIESFIREAGQVITNGW
jgi:hypothetical protein